MITLLAVIGAAAYLSSRPVIDRIVESPDMRKLVGAKIAKELQGECGVQPITWEGSVASSPALLARTPGSLKELRALGLAATCSSAELWHGEVRIERLAVEHLQAAFSSAAVAELKVPLPVTPDLEPPAEKESSIKLHIVETVIARTDLQWGDKDDAGGFRDVATSYYPDGKNLVVHGNSGTFRQTGWPEAEVGSLKLRYEKPVLRIEEGSLTLGGKSLVSVGGTFTFAEQPSMDLLLNFERCGIAPFLSKEQRSKFSGIFKGETRIKKLLGTEAPADASGSLVFANAAVENIQALEKLALFTGVKEFRRLTFEQLRANYEWTSPKLKVENLVLEAKGLLRAEGGLTANRGAISGTLRLGVTGAVLERVRRCSPPREAAIFGRP